MRLIVTIATGERKYGDLALNLCLSIKCHTPDQKILLIYEPSAIKGIEELIDKYFDYGLSQFRHTDTAVEFAFWLKTQLYDTVLKTVPEATEVIFLDADTIMLPSKTVNNWFEKHQGRPFTAYCNDIYDLKTKKRKRKDYTFWCDPDKVKIQLGIPDNKMPQINSSFLYFEKCELTKAYFDTVKSIWDNEDIEFKEYRNTKPDELCFNIASAITNILPHQNTYRPIFFQFGSEQQSIPYITHYYKAFGFAGDAKPYEYLVKFYNDISDYYREHFGVIEHFVFDGEDKIFKDYNPLKILPLKRRTLFRQGEVANSDGGIFNPDAILTKDGRLMTIMRKEVDYDVYKKIYSTSTSIPFVYFDESDYYDLTPVGYPKETRLEDYRIFKNGDKIMCNHKIIIFGTQNQRDMKTCLSVIDGSKLKCIGIPNLPTKLNRTDINWAFFCEGDFMYCVYSVNPYRLFVSTKSSDYKIWDEVQVDRPELDWFHKDQFICNSTNPILLGDYYLMFYHSKSEGIYFHGALLINKESKHIEYYTKNSFQLSTKTEGRQKGILYISGSVYLERENVVRLYFGEADSHSSYIEYHKDLLVQEIKANHA